MISLFKKVFSVSKKILIVIFAYLLIFALFNSFTKNDSYVKNYEDPTIQNRKEIYKIVNDPNLQKTKKGRAYVNTYKVVTCTLIGEACTNNPNDGDKNFPQSLLGYATNLLIFPYTNPPASGIYWAYSGLQNAGFVAKSYAAEGIGFSSLKPLMSIWVIFRNLAYIFLVLFIVTVGFMIMFRFKINPQTVITLENTLPRIVASLLLITFSFAIAGFLIDMMYVVILIGVSALGKADPTLNSAAIQSQYVTSKFGDLWDSMFPQSGGWTRVPLLGGIVQLSNLGQALVLILPSWINSVFRWTVGLGLSIKAMGLLFNENAVGVFPHIAKLLDNVEVLGSGLGNVVGHAVSFILKFLLFPILAFLTFKYGAGWILGLVIALTILLLIIRIFVLLIISYLKILFLIIFSPMILLFETIPGKNAFSYWIKNLLAELSIFPIVIFLLVLGRLIVNIFNKTSIDNTNIWRPPFIHGIDAKNLAIVLGMGLIFMIPNLARFAKQKISGSKGEGGLGLGLGVFFGGATGVYDTTMGQLQKFYYMSSVKDMVNRWRKKPSTTEH